MKHYHLAVIPGDGIGPEVIAESEQTLAHLAEIHGGTQFESQHFDWGTERYLREGALMPVDGLSILEHGGFDGILLGPVGDPRVPDHITLWGLILPIRQAFDQYVNLRPMRLLPGVQSPLANKRPQDIDMVCIRENTEGEYAGAGGRIHQGTDNEVAIQSTIFTRKGTERIIRYAFDYARQYGRKKVTSATKSNSMQFNMVFWDDVFRQVAADYSDIAHEQQLIDSLSARFVARPESLDVVVASNLFGDILTDLGAAISGSMGLAPSANINPERRYPSLFQAIHGSAPDIVGQGIANPIASIWSGQLMLDFLGEHEAATLLMGTIERVLADGQIRTPDLGGTATTKQMGQCIRERLQRV
ncbi:tartrate dehydrogenase [Dictyobacter sp. S3.2.2.5]|uniref:D-malate dehydrogenase (decarboxylating) n=1 Tax=Dictyobacter halimunensis TaxID=3026934 RepID=A0ABQ6FJJ7_9CHLR|nr:tartrate dehydrogenase [Dictyobacter sp. S3.2.2.5]